MVSNQNLIFFKLCQLNTTILSERRFIQGDLHADPLLSTISTVG